MTVQKWNEVKEYGRTKDKILILFFTDKDMPSTLHFGSLHKEYYIKHKKLKIDTAG